MKFLLIISIAFQLVTFNKLSAQVGTVSSGAEEGMPEMIHTGDGESFVWLNYREDERTLPQLTFTDITEETFLKYYKPTARVVDSSKVNWADTTYTIQTSKAKITFDHMPKNYNYNKRIGWHNYKGYLPELDMYILESWTDGEFLLGELYVLDSMSSILYLLNTDTDGPANDVFISPDDKYMLYYGNSVVGSPSCNMGVAKAYQKEGITYYKNYKGVSIEGQYVKDYAWKDDKTLLLKILNRKYDRESREWKEHYTYVKTIL